MADALDLVIRARRVMTEDGEVARSIGISAGRIAAVSSFDEAPACRREMVLHDDVVLLPGLVDSHVHICEPGNTEWEGFESATRAAAAGGITTLVDMPLDSLPVTVDVAALAEKVDAATGKCFVDVGFWGGVVPGNLGSLRSLADAGVLGFKCFLIDSGLPDFPPVDATVLEAALAELSDIGRGCQSAPDGFPLLVHAEDGAIAAAQPPVHGSSYEAFLRTRPPAVEDHAVEVTLEAARRTGGWAHVCHISGAGALPAVEAAQVAGVRVTAETCPHYLSLTAEEIADGATAFKCCPPVREAGNRDRLWAGLASGVIGLVVSDHSPCTPAMKHLEDGDFGAAWGGVSSLQLSLPVVWTEARVRGFSLREVVRWMAQETACLAGLPQKGRIAPGCDADLVVFDPDESFTVEADRLHHRHKLTPYDGRKLTGRVRATLLRGEPANGGVPKGRLLRRRGRAGKVGSGA